MPGSAPDLRGGPHTTASIYVKVGGLEPYNYEGVVLKEQNIRYVKSNILEMVAGLVVFIKIFPRGLMR
jgi:hypothetical protein